MSDDLAKEVTQQDTCGAANTALRVRCPSCRHTITLLDDPPPMQVGCPVCGSHFSLISVQATSEYRRQLPKTVGRFELIDQVGFGHMGTIWKARDAELDRIVAVKIPRKDRLDAAEMQQFLREARAAAQVRHPNIVAVHEVGWEEDAVYIVSDFVEGANLSEWLTGQRLNWREAAELCIKIAEALDCAHEAGVVHRDLKPGNIMMDAGGRPYVTDFGLAKRESGEITMTVDGRVLGTPAYMSPEQARGRSHEADRRSDVYSLGVILYELLTGELPFRGEPRMLIVQILRDEPTRPRKLNSRIPHDLETICLKCLEKDPDRRYATAGEVAADLRRFLDGQPVRARPVGTFGRMWRWYYRHPEATVQVAGVYTTFCAVLCIIWGIEGLLVFALAPQFAANRARGVTEIALIFVGLYLPSLWAGIKTLNGRAYALWIGLAIYAVGLCMAAAGLLGMVVYTSVLGEPHVRLGLLILLADLCFLGIVVHVVAIVSHSRHRAETAGKPR